MNLRTTLLAIATIGLFATAFAAPVSAQETQVPPDKAYPGYCMDVYFFVYEIGPVTVDASTSCWKIIVNHAEACSPEDVRDLTDDCRKAIEDLVNDTCEEELAYLACDIRTDPCDYIYNGCHCTCDPIESGLLAE